MPVNEKKGVFSGLVITSFSWAVVGPLTMKYFADYGATVIRVESTKRPCTLRISSPFKDGQPGFDRSGYFNHFSSNILSMTLNMERPEAFNVVSRMVQVSDVFMENFSPGVIEKWGLDYENLKTIKPDIIMLRQSGFGTEGPHARQPVFGMILAAKAGIPNFIGWPDGGPLPIGVSAYTDGISPRFATAAVIAALDYRRKTGKGQFIDISQLETSLYFILPALLDYAVNGREPERTGNANPQAAPHGVFPCLGNDRWCTIAAFDETQWKALCEVTRCPELANDARFSTLEKRKENEDELNRLISEWTRERTPEVVMVLLQNAGIPSGIVKNAEDIYNDPQLRERGLFWSIQHPEMGTFTHLGQGFKFTKTPAQPYRPSPCIGEHTEYVCTKLLGMSDDEFAGLAGSGVFE